MNYILLTSCFKPRLAFNVSNHNVLLNVLQAQESVQAYLRSSLYRTHCHKIILIDCSDYTLLDDNVLIQIDDCFVKNPLIDFVRIPFSSVEVERVVAKGKGYSECLMIEKFLNSYSFPVDAGFWKSSARYIPLFSPSSFFPFSIKKDVEGSFAYSVIARKVIAHSYFCNLSLLRDLTCYCMNRVNDANGIILEAAMFEYISHCKNNKPYVINRSKFYPFYHPKVQPGTASSRRFSSSLFLQLLRSIACAL